MQRAFFMSFAHHTYSLAFPSYRYLCNLQSNTMITTRTLNPTTEAETYKAFFMQGLVAEPESFRISPADEALAAFPTAEGPESYTLGAFDGEQLVGVASYERQGKQREKLRHKGHLFRMYVAPTHRGRGIARQLILGIVERTDAQPEIDQITLTAVATNEKALALYGKLGFEVYGIEENAIKYQGQSYTEAMMVLRMREE